MLNPILAFIGDVLQNSKLWGSGELSDMLRHNWYLGLTSFGGPAVHFQIVRTHLGQLSTRIPSTNTQTVPSIICREAQMD